MRWADAQQWNLPNRKPEEHFGRGPEAQGQGTPAGTDRFRELAAHESRDWCTRSKSAAIWGTPAGKIKVAVTVA
jgi:hypothetical protein